MATTIVMPQMGYDMREGTVVRWHKSQGDTIARGDVIAEIETDKATVEMEAYSSGVLGRIVVEEGRAVPVGELIAVITQPGEEVPSLESLGESLGESPGAAPAGAPQAPAPSATAVPAPQAAAPEPGAEVRASPIARRLAREKGIELSLVQGTGPGGRVTEADVLAFGDGAAAAPAPATAAAPSVTQAPAERVELTRMRRAIAAVTVQSKREAPHFYVTSEIDMTEAMALRRQVNDALQDGVRVSVNDLLIRASVLALHRYPKLNASFQGDYLLMNQEMNIGIAIALEEGLMVPAIAGCQSMSLADVARASADLIQRAQGGRLRAEEYTGGTFAISNLGMFDVESFAAIIFPPNAAVLAVGTVKEQPVVREGQITVAQIMKATLSVDHRVADGAEGAQFVGEVKRLLEHPVSLLL